MSKPIGWTIASVAELSSYVTSGSRDWSRYYADEGAYFVRTQDINTNSLVPWESVARVSLPVDVEGKRTLVRGGDLLVTITGANVGKVAEIVEVDPPEAYVSQSVALVRLVDSSMAPFVHRQLLSPVGVESKTELEQRAYGVGRPVLSLDDVRETSIRLPPLAEQSRIVAKLDALTSSIKRARFEIDRCRSLSAKLRNGALREAFASSSEDMRVLGDALLDIRYGTAQKCDYGLGSTPVLRIPNLRDGQIDISDLKSADFGEFEISRLALELGDLLVIRSNGSLNIVGRSAVVEAAHVGLLYAGYLIRLRPDQNQLLPRYLRYCLDAPQTREMIEKAARSSSGVNNINAQQLQNLTVPLIRLEEQEALVSKLDAVFARADRLEAEAARALAILDRLEASILAKAFRGELVPQDPNDEPASVLLERIRAARAAAPKPTRKRRTTAG